MRTPAAVLWAVALFGHIVVLPASAQVASPGGEGLRRAVARGAAVGGTLGAGAGLFLGALASNGASGGNSEPGAGGQRVEAALLVGAGGAAAGAALGAAIPIWTLRWSSEARRASLN